jgi:prepilin-type N-terminal cleavage/methylation domain-containing protein
MMGRRPNNGPARPLRDAQFGFTLLEVLVALIIIGISLGALFQAFSQSKRIAWKSDEKAEGARITQNILANSPLIKAALRENGKQGVVEGEKQWEYAISVHPLELEAEDLETLIEVPSMLKLNLVLVHNTGQNKRTFHLNRWYRHRINAVGINGGDL